MALRLFLTSDLHLGMKFAGYPDAARAALVEARFTCLDRIVGAANEARADLLVIAGDLFETVNVARREEHLRLPRQTHRCAAGKSRLHCRR